MTSRLVIAGVKEGSECGYEGQHKGSFGDGNVLCLHCINVKILIFILYHSFTIRYHWGKLDKGYLGSLCIISYNCL